MVKCKSNIYFIQNHIHDDLIIEILYHILVTKYKLMLTVFYSKRRFFTKDPS